MTTAEPSLVARLRVHLPRGNSLPDAAWKRRHRFLLVLLWSHAVALPAFGLAEGVPLWRCLLWGLVIAALATVCTVGRNRRAWWVSATMSVGLLTCSAVLISFWDGQIEAHFHFFVMIVLLTLYEEWLPFLIAAAYVAVHHILVGSLDPGAVYNHPAAVEHPWRWALIHAGFVAAAGAAALVAWRLNEDVREEHQRALDRAVAAEAALAASALDLERSNRELEQFAAVASHDLSEPLHTMRGFLGLLRDRYGARLDDAGRDFVGHAVDGADRMQRLIDGLLDLSRLRSEAPRLAPVALDDVVAGARDALGARVAATGAAIACDDDLPTVLGDAAQLTRAVQNVLANALKFPRPGEAPHVTVSARQNPAEWSLRIADRGIGVPADARERVFSMFHRVDGAHAHDGAGLGLAIVERIAARHGGTVWLEETPGGGATVVLCVPAAPVALRGCEATSRSADADLARAGG